MEHAQIITPEATLVLVMLDTQEKIVNMVTEYKEN